MADKPASSSQSTAKNNLIGASRVFILTPEMLKKLGLAEKVQLIQNQLKPENKVQLITEVNKLDSPVKLKKIEKLTSKNNNKMNEKKLPQKKENSMKSLENENFINSNKLEKEINLQKSEIITEELNLISDKVQNSSQFKLPVKTLENQKLKISSGDEKEEVESRLKQLFGDTSPQKLKESEDSNEDLEKSFKLSESPEKMEEKKLIQVPENSNNSLESSCDSPETQSTLKIRSKIKPKVQWRSRKFPLKDEKKEILDSPKSPLENEEKSVTDEELSTKSLKIDEKIENNLLNKVEKSAVLSPKSVYKCAETVSNREADSNLEPKNIENDEEKSSNAFEVETPRSPEKIGSESEEIIEETLEFIEEVGNSNECEEQASKSLEDDKIEAPDEFSVTKTLETEDNDESLNELREKMSNSSESAVKTSDENVELDEGGCLNEPEEKSSFLAELPLNNTLEPKNSDQHDFPVELWDDDDSNGFAEIYCPSPRSSSDDEAYPALEPAVLENSEENRLQKNQEEPEESPDTVIDKIDANSGSLAEEPEVADGIEDNRLDKVEEINVQDKSAISEERSCSSNEDKSEKKSVDEVSAQIPEFPEKIEDNHLNEPKDKKLDFPVATSLSSADKLGIESENDDHSSVSTERTDNVESVKSKENVSRRSLSESSQRQGELEDFKLIEKKEKDQISPVSSKSLLTQDSGIVLTEEVIEAPKLNSQENTDTDNEALTIINSSDNSRTDVENLVIINGNVPVPSLPNESVPVSSGQQEESQESLETLELRKKTVRMNLLGLSERVSVDSSFPKSAESSGTFETPDIQSNDQVPLTSRIKKRRNILVVDTIETKPAKVARRGKRGSDVNSTALGPVLEAITPPVRSSRRRSKPKIFEDCVSPLTTRRTSAASRRKQEVINNDDKLLENPVIPSENFSAMSEDTESPKKLIIDESKFESDRESNCSDFRRIVDEEKTDEFVESKISEELKDEPKIDENARLESLDSGICPVTQESQKKSKKIKSKRRKSSRFSKKKSTKGTQKSSQITEDVSEIPTEIPEEIAPENDTAEVSKTPEIPHLSADNEVKMEENPVETPPELSPQCPVVNPASNTGISNVPESSESVVSPSSTSKTRKRRGRPKGQSLITHFLQSSPVPPHQSEDSAATEVEIPLKKTRGRKRKLAQAEDEANVPEEPDAAEQEETSRSRSRRTTVKPDETDGEGLSESDEDKSKITEETPRSRRNQKGRRNASQSAGDRDYVPRVTKPSETIPAKPKEASQTIKCGKCQEEMLLSAWAKHSLAKHNNMSWQDGEEKPDFDDEKRLKNLLTKARKKKASLVCETCGESKRSVVGFISHIRFCGKSENEKQSLMWICPLCTAVLMPSSREYHEKQHRDNQLSRVHNYAGEDRQKRRAAEKAVTEISKFTALVLEGEEPSSKKKKTKITVQDFIQQPQMFKTIPGVWKGAWARSINNNEKAHCRQPGCTFSTDNLHEICAHHSTCNFTPRVSFICKICKILSASQSEIEQHVKTEHSDKFNDEDSDFAADNSDYSDGDNNDATKIKRPFKPRNVINYSQAKFLTDTFAYKKLTGNLTFIPSFQWTFDFELQHFSFYLFDELKPNIFTKSKDVESYLPQIKTSMSITHGKTKKGENIDWKKWKRFESHVISDVPTFYTGGPVWALAWLPLPAALYDKQLDQYVAVSTHRTIGATYEVGTSHKFKNSIQIWRIGHLSYDSTVLEDPQLSYIVNHEYGTIWCMEWCPSGAYDHENLHALNSQVKGMRRMGLLAAASSSGLVLIYSLPFSSELKIPDDNYKSKVFETEPVMILQVNGALPSESVNWQCMKLSWSKTSGHDILVAGFSNGYVAVWDLTAKSPILRRQVNRSVYLDAYKHFYAHNHAVMFVDLVPVGEKRYLATASMDRSSKTWDLEDTSAPVSIIKKGIAVDGVWMTHWPTSLTCYDDALTLQHTQTYATNVRGLPNRITPLLPTNSTTYAIAKSDWANGVCHGTLAGEIIAAFPPQLLYLREIDRWSKDRWLVTNIEIVDFGKEKTKEKNDYHYLPETYDKCQEKFGIIFHDDLDNLKCTAFRKINKRKGFLSSDTMEHAPIERYPFTSINRISWNTNAWSYLWLAVGYENGFVRILNLNRMSVRSIIDEMLSKHAESMFKKAEQLNTS